MSCATSVLIKTLNIPSELYNTKHVHCEITVLVRASQYHEIDSSGFENLMYTENISADKYDLYWKSREKDDQVSCPHHLQTSLAETTPDLKPTTS